MTPVGKLDGRDSVVFNCGWAARGNKKGASKLLSHFLMLPVLAWHVPLHRGRRRGDRGFAGSWSGPDGERVGFRLSEGFGEGAGMMSEDELSDCTVK
jgi:hypothetical protein